MTNTTNSNRVLDSSNQLAVHFPVDMISKLAPTDYHQNNDILFKLARLVKSYEHAIGRPATPQELEVIFERWAIVARRFWRPEMTRDDYYAEFLECYGYARIGLDENPIDVAVSRAKAAPLPEVEGFTDERIRLLASICREMHDITRGGPFFLPTRKLGEMLHVDFPRIARWLRALEALGVIHLAPGEVRKQGGNRSPRYYYGQPLRGTGAVAIPMSPTSAQPVLLPNGDHSNEVAGANHADSDKLSLCSCSVVYMD